MYISNFHILANREKYYKKLNVYKNKNNQVKKKICVTIKIWQIGLAYIP